MLFHYPEKPRELLQASQTHNQRSVELEGTLEIHMSKGLILEISDLLLVPHHFSFHYTSRYSEITWRTSWTEEHGGLQSMGS